MTIRLHLDFEMAGFQSVNENDNATGWWCNGSRPPELGIEAFKASLYDVYRPVFVVNYNNRIAVGRSGKMSIGNAFAKNADAYPLFAYAPPLPPENLGNDLFKRLLGIRYAYIVGAMANGITSTDMVKAAAHAGIIGFFGAAGLTPDKVESSIVQLKADIEKKPFGMNLIYSPSEPDNEMAVVNKYLEHQIRIVSASAYLNITLPLVYYRIKGIFADSKDVVQCPNKVIAKVSRVEIARKFLSPPPEKIVNELLNRGLITEKEAYLAARVPVADAITAEADSGGHTDNRPAISLLPTVLSLRDEIISTHDYPFSVFVGLAGGIATPAATAGAFAMGADYVLTGSINQGCVESGTSTAVREMLAETEQADVTMAPAADMFEMGVKVQVLKRGTMFPFKASKLYDIFSSYNSLEEIPEKQREVLERDFFRQSLDQEWVDTKAFFLRRDPKQIHRAETNAKHKMALVFRSYLGQSSLWAIQGNPSRKIDYQIWCGPSMGAFNQWVKGSFLEKAENRNITTIAMNLLFGATVHTRKNWIRNQGVAIDSALAEYSPLTLEQLSEFMNYRSV
jgi:PfaD family protein